jgi:threonine/homoserine/homoserine lactone efflux protein
MSGVTGRMNAAFGVRFFDDFLADFFAAFFAVFLRAAGRLAALLDFFALFLLDFFAVFFFAAAIASLERLARGRGKRRGRPPAWLAMAKKRGRPAGSKNKTKSALKPAVA